MVFTELLTQVQYYLSATFTGKENTNSTLLASVKSRAAFILKSISELFQSPSLMLFHSLKVTSFLFCAFSTMAGLSFMSDESYCSQNSKGDLCITEFTTDCNSGNMSRGYCCFRSILCLSHSLECISRELKLLWIA